MNYGKNHSPSLLKPSDIKQIEENIDSSFHRKVSVFLASKGIKNIPWNRYFLKQHYGVKTRLLDWTENAFIALFSALSDESEKAKGENAMVWILSPIELIPNRYQVVQCSNLNNETRGSNVKVPSKHGADQRAALPKP